MAFVGSSSANGCADEDRKLSRRPRNLLASPSSLDSCRASLSSTASNSTETPSEVASAIAGECSPRVVESTDGVMKRSARPDMDDAPLSEMFADSDDDLRVFSPSKSARRRMRRQRQRDALKVVLANAQLVEEPEVTEEVRAYLKEPQVFEARHGDIYGWQKPSTIVTLDQIGIELGGYGTKAGETSEGFLVSTPLHSAPRTPGVLSTNPCSDSPASLASSSMVRATPVSDAASRGLLTPVTPQSVRATPVSDAASRQLLTPATPQSVRATHPHADASHRHPPSADASQRTPTPVTPKSYSLAEHFWSASPCNSSSWGAQIHSPPAGQPAADNALRLMFDVSSGPSGDIVATLQAAAPEVYEE